MFTIDMCSHMTTMIMAVIVVIICSLFVTDDSFAVGSSFELLFEVRPRNLNGLLLHVGDFNRTRNTPPTMDHHLSLYMLRGEVNILE